MSSFLTDNRERIDSQLSINTQTSLPVTNESTGKRAANGQPFGGFEPRTFCPVTSTGQLPSPRLLRAYSANASFPDLPPGEGRGGSLQTGGTRLPRAKIVAPPPLMINIYNYFVIDRYQLFEC